MLIHRSGFEWLAERSSLFRAFVRINSMVVRRIAECLMAPQQSVAGSLCSPAYVRARARRAITVARIGASGGALGTASGRHLVARCAVGTPCAEEGDGDVVLNR